MGRDRLLVIRKCLLELAASSDRLQRQTLLTLNFISQAFYFFPEIRVVSGRLAHLVLSLIKFILNQQFLLCLLPKH